jgi:hypothetical protein
MMTVNRREKTMNEEQRREFEEFCRKHSFSDEQVRDFGDFVERVAEAAFDRGQVSGASPFDGSFGTDA